MEEMNQIDDTAYFMGWNKRIELTKKGQVFIYSERNQNGSMVRLRCNVSDKRVVIEKKGKSEKEFVEIGKSNVIRGAIVDLGNDGERWEGDLLNGLPFGYGCMYNNENELVYSGFMYEGERVCFGEEFQQAMVHYSGTFLKNRRHGVGKAYNLKGELVYEGNWYFGKNVVEDVEITSELGDSVIHNGMKKLTIGNGYQCDLKELKLTDFPSLESISIGNDCFKGVESFEVSNCVKLEIVEIGTKSFHDGTLGRLTGIFHVHDCGNLREITIHNDSFIICSNLTLESKFD